MIKVINCKEATTKTGKPYKQLEVECEGEVRKVNMWSNYPNFANIQEGSQFDGKMVKEGQYWNLPIDGPTSRPGASGGFKTAQIKETMDIKRQDIQESQKNKELGIKISSTIRMATDVATSLTPEQWQSTTMQEEIKFWRAWFWNEWDNIGPDVMKPF